MKIEILCTDDRHPVIPYLQEWMRIQALSNSVMLRTSKADLQPADLLFLVSCHELISSEIREQYRSALVLHASALPQGRGWSPHVWQILAGGNHITVSLIEADDPVDSGAVWATRDFVLQGNELCNEINEALFTTELELMKWAVDNFCSVVPQPQSSGDTAYHSRRRPEDSRLDPALSITEQFDQMRIADPERYPTFFDLRGCRYRIILKKESKDE